MLSKCLKLQVGGMVTTLFLFFLSRVSITAAKENTIFESEKERESSHPAGSAPQCLQGETRS